MCLPKPFCTERISTCKLCTHLHAHSHTTLHTHSHTHTEWDTHLLSASDLAFFPLCGGKAVCLSIYFARELKDSPRRIRHRQLCTLGTMTTLLFSLHTSCLRPCLTWWICLGKNRSDSSGKLNAAGKTAHALINNLCARLAVSVCVRGRVCACVCVCLRVWLCLRWWKCICTRICYNFICWRQQQQQQQQSKAI